MDPQKTQNPIQDNPQAPTPSAAPQSAQAQQTTPTQPEPMRPAQASPISVPTSEQRPVAPWPPNQTGPAPVASPATPSAPQPSVVTSPTTTEAVNIGTETTMLAGAVPSPAPVPQPQSMGTNKSVDGFNKPVPPAAEVKLEEPARPMSGQEAEALFNEEQNPGGKKPRKKITKVVKIVVAILVFLLLATGLYVFFMGNSAAQSYKNSTGLENYKNAFQKISDSLNSDQPKTEELEAALNELQTTNTNSAELQVVVLGTLNPNYKNAKNFDVSYSAFAEKAKTFSSKYANSANYISAITGATSALDNLSTSTAIDLKTVTAEELTTSLTEYSENCSKAATKLQEATPPEGYEEATSSMIDILKKDCKDAYLSAVTELLIGKTGALNTDDQTSISAKLKALLDTNVLALNGSASAGSSFNINQITSFSRSVADEAKALQQEAEVILAG